MVLLNAAAVNRQPQPATPRGGVVHTWRRGSRYGFIADSADGRQWFAHVDDTRDRQALTPGDVVSFRVEADTSGRFKAVDVRVLAESTQASDQAAVRHEGVIDRFRQDMHFGFIRADGRELFFHGNEAHPASLIAPGRRVRFDIIRDRHGRECASRVRIVEEL